MAAAVLSQAGFRVVVLEKSTYIPKDELTLREKDAFQTMYERGGLLVNDDFSMAVLAGSTFGGGKLIPNIVVVP